MFLFVEKRQGPTQTLMMMMMANSTMHQQLQQMRILSHHDEAELLWRQATAAPANRQRRETQALCQWPAATLHLQQPSQAAPLAIA